MSDKKIICKNDNKIEVAFSYDENEAFFLTGLEGVYAFQNKVTTEENTNIDGSTFIGSSTIQRNIVITSFMCNNYKENRDILYKCFKPKSNGTFIYCEDDFKRKIEYKVESLEIEEAGVIRNISISLICPDPFFKSNSEVNVVLAGGEGSFQFPHEFLEEKESFGIRRKEIIKTFDNDGTAYETGLKVTFEAIDTVVNPEISCLDTGQVMKLNYIIEAGDSIEITTGKNNKNAVYKSNDEEININAYITNDTEFIQLQPGNNTVRYDADEGADSLNVKITYTEKYLGV